MKTIRYSLVLLAREKILIIKIKLNIYNLSGSIRYYTQANKKSKGKKEKKKIKVKG